MMLVSVTLMSQVFFFSLTLGFPLDDGRDMTLHMCHILHVLLMPEDVSG